VALLSNAMRFKVPETAGNFFIAEFRILSHIYYHAGREQEAFGGIGDRQFHKYHKRSRHLIS
jgi:hypothetical protein